MSILYCDYANTWSSMVGEWSLGEASAAVAVVEDSNFDYNTFWGDGGAISKMFQQVLGMPKLATCPTHGGFVFTSKRQGNDEYPDAFANTDVLTTAPAAVRPWLPVDQTDGTVISGIDDAIANRPICIDNAGAGNGTTTIATGEGGVAVESRNNSLDFNGREAIDGYIAYVEHGPATPARTLNWRMAGPSPATSLQSGTVDQAAASTLFRVRKVGSLAASGSRTAQYIYMCGAGRNNFHVGPLNLFSQFLTLPGRGHGHVVGPLMTVGGKALADMAPVFQLLTTSRSSNQYAYIDAQLDCFHAAMLDSTGAARRYWFVLWIRHGLNDRNKSSPHNTANGYQSNLEVFLNVISARVAAKIADGTMQGCAGFRAMVDVVGHKVAGEGNDALSLSGMDFCYVGARQAAALRGDTMVADHRQTMSAAEAVRIGDGSNSIHLGSTDEYRDSNRLSFSRIVTAARLAGRLN